MTCGMANLREPNGSLAVEPDQLEELIRLTGVYTREVDRCKGTKAHLAACVMSAAALEAALCVMVALHPDEVLATSTRIPSKKGVPRAVLDWNLSELLDVARDMNWLPEGGMPDGVWDPCTADVSDYAQLIRRLRNLTHPGRYVKEFSRRRVTAKYAKLSEETLAIAFAVLHDKIMETIAARRGGMKPHPLSSGSPERARTQAVDRCLGEESSH